MSDEQYVSGEEHVARSNGHQGARPTAVPLRPIIMVAGIVVLCALSFWGGINYQKHHAKTNTSAASARAGLFGGGSGQRRGGGLGQVTAISDSSVTVQNQRSGESKTYSITSTTAITDNGQTVPASDIKTGDTVIVMATSSGSTAASRILVNPSFGGGQGGPGNTQSD